MKYAPRQRNLFAQDEGLESSALCNQNNRPVINSFAPAIVDSSQPPQQLHSHKTIDKLHNSIVSAKQMKNEMNLGRLDGLVSSPNRCRKVRLIDSNKVAAILLETSNVELQRHLLTVTIQNQASVTNSSFQFL